MADRKQLDRRLHRQLGMRGRSDTRKGYDGFCVDTAECFYNVLLRHSRGIGTAIMPARRTPKNATILSTALGNCIATTVSVCNPNPRNFSASAEIARSVPAKLKVRGAPSVKSLRLGGSARASASDRAR